MELVFLHMELVFLHMELVFLHSFDVAQLVLVDPTLTFKGLFGVNLTLASQLVLVCSKVTSQLVLIFPEYGAP
jgi:hypothetical protein